MPRTQISGDLIDNRTVEYVDIGASGIAYDSTGYILISTGGSSVNWTNLEDEVLAIVEISGTEDNFVSIDANGQPQDSGFDSTSFVAAGLEDSITWSASRNKKATNIYLWADDVQPTNIAPYILPWDAKIVAISASTEIADTWTAEIHSGESLISGASLSIVAADSGYGTYDINLSAGDPIEIYCSGISVEKPRVSVIFRRR